MRVSEKEQKGKEDLEKATVKSSLERESATLKAKTLSTGGYLIESSQYELQGLDAAALVKHCIQRTRQWKKRRKVEAETKYLAVIEKRQGRLGSFPYSNTIHFLLL